MRAKTIFVVLFMFVFSMIWNLPFDSIGVKLSYCDHVLVESLLTSKSRAESLGAETTASRIVESLRVLESSRRGRLLTRYLRESGVSIRFGNPQTRGAAAVFVPGTPSAHAGEIVVDLQYASQPPSVLAAIIAHEISHARSYQSLSELSLPQELQAYRVEAEVWRELRRNYEISAGPVTLEVFEPSPENDYALWISQMEKGKALRSIKHDYKRLGIDTT